MKQLFYFILSFCLIINFISCDKYLDRSTHSLYNKPDLISAKSLIPNGLGYAQEFIFERSTLAGDQLNLSSWGGFNEIIWNTKTEWKEVNLKARLENSYLWLFITANEKQKFGIRISTNSKFESGFFELNADKLFVNSQSFKIEPPSPEVNISLSYRDNLLSLKINEKPIFEKSVNLTQRLFSFGSSLVGSVTVNSLQMTNSDNSTLWVSLLKHRLKSNVNRSFSVLLTKVIR